MNFNCSLMAEQIVSLKRKKRVHIQHVQCMPSIEINGIFKMFFQHCFSYFILICTCSFWYYISNICYLKMYMTGDDTHLGLDLIMSRLLKLDLKVTFLLQSNKCIRFKICIYALKQVLLIQKA